MEDPEEFESWGNEFVRGSDPETSHEAAARLDPVSACGQAFRIFYYLVTHRFKEDGIQGAEYQQAIQNFLIARGWPKEMAMRKADSLRRRLSDLEDPDKEWQLIEVRYEWVDAKNGQMPARKVRRRGRRQIYYLRAPGVEVEGF